MSLIPTEYQEQKTLVEWLQFCKKNIKFTSIPNSTFTKSWKQKAKNTASGLYAGFPDMVLIIPTKSGQKRFLALELKRKKGGVISPHQKEWIKELSECAGIYCNVAKGFEEAKYIIEQIEKT